MRGKHSLLLVALGVGFVTLSMAQHRTYNIVNGFGIHGGITMFDVITNNFETKSSTGWVGGMSSTVDIPHRWYNVSYTMQLSENNFEVYGRSNVVSIGEEPIEFKMFTAQVALLAHVKLIGANFTLDVGPMLQYNSELELKDKSQESFVLTNYDNLTADEIKGINQFNADGTVGLTVGYDSFKLRAQYIYGFTNILNKLNSKDLDISGSNESKFKGNLSMLMFTVIFTF